VLPRIAPGKLTGGGTREGAGVRGQSLPTLGRTLTRFLDDGRIEIDSNVVERSIRPIALNRKNALFAGSDAGGEHWAVVASLIETCKLNGVEPTRLPRTGSDRAPLASFDP
jgi:hypothetical protein